MTDLGCVLVHGYTGSPEDLDPLADRLASEFGDGAVTRVLLPGHGGGAPPPFDAGALVALVARAIEARARTCRRLVLVGHSTGGSLLLAATASLPAPPALAVLACTPPWIDAGYAARWSRHGGGGPALDDVGELAALVNGLARGPRLPFPVLAIHGDADALVPAAEAVRWLGRAAAVRLHRIPGGGHDLFRGLAGPVAVDAVARAVRDAGFEGADPANLDAWRSRVPELTRGLERWPASIHHLREGPAGRSLAGREVDAKEVALAEPTVLNVSITTRCDLACPACARTFGRVRGEDMPPERFERILEQVPHALRVVLVGLGEPLLHPEVVEMVRLAAAPGRRVSVVTNGIHLDREVSRALLAAGIGAVTVSVDAMSPAAVARARPGTDVAAVLGNLRGLVEERSRAGLAGKVGVAVFTALAVDTAGELDAIADAIAPLGVDALMATDLNFPENAARTLHRSMTPALEARLDRVLRSSLARGLPVMSVHALEELAVPERFREFLLLRGAALAARSDRHSHCRSPWQTLVVDPQGEVTVCDCQPAARLGNVLREPFSAIWDGEAMRTQRRRMGSEIPPGACAACPRF